VGEHCEGCRRRLNTGWTYCPFCGKSASTPREAQVLPHPGRDRRQKRTRLEVAADEPVRKAS
jgi:uncharacterized Zn finger protein (UPF0148 family)